MIKRGFLFIPLALAAAALCSCSADEAGNAAPDSGTAVQVTAQVKGNRLALTRGADALDDATSGFSLLTGTNDDSKINIRVDNGSGAYENYPYSITGGTTITPPATPPYFPAGVTTVNVYGWYPENGGSTAFTVKDDQQSDANYCLSDVMVAQPTTSTRTLNNDAWSVTPAELSFQHIMAKVKITLAPVDDVKITQVRLLNVKKTATLQTTGSPVVSGVSSVTSGDPGAISLLSGGNVTSGSTVAQKTLCGVFPAQNLTGNFLEVTAEYGGLSNTITYSLATEKNFASDQQYNITTTVGIIRTNETVSVTGWALNDTNPLEISVGSITDPAAMRSGDCLALNPLYWMAQYNVQTIKGVTDYSLDTPAPAEQSSFYGYHAIPCNAFQYDDACKLAENSTININYDASATITDFHLPTFYEQASILPSKVDIVSTNTDSGWNIFGLTKTTPNDPSIIEQIACDVAGTTVPACMSYFLKVGQGDYYAVRFVSIGSANDYASAWHYKFIIGNGLLIESYMLEKKPTTDEEIKEILAALPNTSVWAGMANMAPESNNPTSSTSSLVRRFLPASGYGTDDENGSGGLSSRSMGTEGSYYSASYSDEKCYFFYVLTSNRLYFRTYSHDPLYLVRLFRNH